MTSGTASAALARLVLAVALAVPSGAAAQGTLTTRIGGALADHRVTVNGVPARSAGLVWEGGAHFGPVPWIELRGRIGGGQLTARTAEAEDRRLDELEVAMLVLHGGWLAFGAGAQVRSYATPVGRQRWVALSALAEAGLQLIDDSLRGVIRAAVLPAVSVSGSEAPELAIAMGTGLEYVRGPFVADVSYSLERYDFARVAGTRRAEQLAKLSARVGWRVLR